MKKRTQFLQIGLLFCLMVGMLGLVQPAGAATLTVCSSSVCPYHTISSAVAAASAGDTILVGAGTYHEHDIVIGKNLTIKGAGSQVVDVNAEYAGRIFNIHAGVTATITGMDIAYGKVVAGNGGGILNNGSLTLNDVYVAENEAPSAGAEGGGIYSTGNLTMTNGQVTYSGAGFGGGGIAIRSGLNISATTSITTKLTNVKVFANGAGTGGGGIYLWNRPVSDAGQYASTLILNQVEVDDNVSGVGGGIQALGGTLTITNSAIFTNSADAGGGLFSEGSPALTMTNDTFYNNTAKTNSGTGGGMKLGDDADTLTNVTVFGNSAITGGGIFRFDGTIALADTLVAGNTATSGSPDCNQIHSLDNNLIEYTSGCSITGTTSHNITGVNPKLDISINENGGPTETVALLPGSPAIDAGNNSTCASTDQRGVARPVGAFCDIGAYEFQPNSTTKIASATPNPSLIGQSVLVSVTVSGGSGIPTGKVAITGANSNCTITLSAGAGHCNVTFTSGGSKTLIATYSGDAHHHKSTAALGHQVFYQITYQSLGPQDGWVLESAQGSNRGGSLNASASTFQLGDDVLNRQYRAFLSFNTASLPRTAVLQKAVLKIDQSGSPAGINPFTSLGSLVADMRTGYFGSSSALELADFNAAASVINVGSFDASPSSGWYSLTLGTSGRAAINRTNLTQFRLRFSKATNANNQADYMNFLSGNTDATSLRPQLIVFYTFR